jgi:hypothetical protein
MTQEDAMNLYTRGMIEIEPSKELLDYFNTQRVIIYNDGSEVMKSSNILVKDVNGKYWLFQDEFEYITYLKSKK